MYRKVLEKGRCLEFYGGKICCFLFGRFGFLGFFDMFWFGDVFFWEVVWDFLISFDLEMVEDLVFGSSFLVKDYIESEKRCKQFIFYIKFNQFLSFLASDILGFAGLKKVTAVRNCEGQWQVGAAFFWGEANKSLSIANKDQDHSCVERQLHAAWHEGCPCQSVLFSGIFFRRCFHPEWFATWLWRRRLHKPLC